MRRAALLVVGLLLVAPPALAHASDMSGVFGMHADGLGVFLQADRLVVKALRETIFNGTVVTNASGPPTPVAEPSVEIELAGPGQASVEITPREGGFQARTSFPAPGEWTALAHYEGQMRPIPIHVYPPTSVWMESSNLRADYHYAAQPVDAQLYFLDDETGVVVAATQAATGRLSRLVDDTHVEMLDVVLPPGPMGSVVFAHTFREAGEYVLAVASEEHGVSYASLPEIVFTVKEPLRSAAATPGAGVGMLVAVAAALALLRRR